MTSLLTEIKPPVLFYPNFLNSADNLDWFQKSQNLEWTRGEINMYGKLIPVPREESLFGDDLHYAYRGSQIKAAPWPDFLLEAREACAPSSAVAFTH
jgi:hypothetical protein